ncbi:ATP-binding protein [Klenkia terrae]|uniref:ATP-binding protein n=1 Tax=Klenkia terrae TaxID=1052259 RepID=A0ABU8E550_9ACTN|nr:ATP-binding protein [Klenkia terrae]SSC25922.1 Histidine kinase/HSP90-like ATPase superfamily protein [Klenkia terrae]
MKSAQPSVSTTGLLGVWTLATVAELPQVRAELRRQLAAGTADPDAAGELVMLADELASNGLRHGSPPVQMTVSTTATGWLVMVTDGAGTRAPAEAVGRDPALGGLGLHMVAAMGEDGGWFPDRGRKTVWATVSASAA